MANNLSNEAGKKQDFRAPSESKIIPKAVADASTGIIQVVAEVAGTPDAVFNALTTSEVEKWWKYTGFYHQKDWKAELKTCGAWSVTVQLNDGNEVHAFGEFCELVFPNKIVMTRRFNAHPFLGDRETTITYHLENSSNGTLVTVRDEGYVGRSQAAYGNAEIWEKVLGWLDGYFIQKEL